MQFEKMGHTNRARAAFIFGPLWRLLSALVAAAFTLTAPAAAPAQQPAPAGAQARSEARTLAGEDTPIRPFRVNIPQEALDDLRRRIAATQWPEKETVADTSQGLPSATMQKLARHWATDYDWRRAEARLNALPQFVTSIDGLDVHFIHVRSKNPGEQYQAPRSWTERAYPKLIYYNQVDRGGHFAAWEQPELFAAELRAAFRSLREGSVSQGGAR